LRKELGAALRPVVKQAKGFVPIDSPMSGWAPRSFSEARFPFYNSNEIKRGITYTTSVGKVNRNGFSSMAALDCIDGMREKFKRQSRTKAMKLKFILTFVLGIFVLFIEIFC
jgi:hypothetical protein